MSIEDSVSIKDSLEIEEQVTMDSVINWQLPVLAILFVSVIFIAIKTVVHRHDSRTAYVKLQVLEKERDRLIAQWSRLKLEQAVTLNQVRVEQYARWDLSMKMPKASEMMVIQEPETNTVLATKKSRNINVSKTQSTDASAEVSKVALGN